MGGGGNSMDASVASMAFWIAEEGLELCCGGSWIPAVDAGTVPGPGAILEYNSHMNLQERIHPLKSEMLS